MVETSGDRLVETGLVADKQHPCMRTTPAIRRAIQASNESISALSRRYGISRHTVAKWKKRSSFENAPRRFQSNVLSPDEEILLADFRRVTLLPLDDCFFVHKLILPHLSRSSLHRCFKRRGISRLSEVARNRKYANPDTPGHIVCGAFGKPTVEGSLYAYSFVDSFTKLLYNRCYREAAPARAADSLKSFVEFLPYRVRSVSFVQSDEVPFWLGNTDGNSLVRRLCKQHGIEQIYLKSPVHWATSRPAGFEAPCQTDLACLPTVDSLFRQYQEFTAMYNFHCKLKSLGGASPYQNLCKLASKHPDWFQRDPATLNLNDQARF